MTVPHLNRVLPEEELLDAPEPMELMAAMVTVYDAVGERSVKT